MGVKQIYITVQPMVKVRKEVVFWVLLLLPSLFFWTSSILKEPFMLLGFGLFLRGLFKDDSLRKKWTFAILGSLLMVGFKPYVFFMLIPMLLFIGLTRLLPKYKIIGAFVILGVLGSITFPYFLDREKSHQKRSVESSLTLFK